MTKETLFALMKGTVIVSCQATPGEPLYDRERSVMPLMARAAKLAGAKMIRTSSVRDIVEIKEETGLPVIGLIKREYPGFQGRITMTMREVDECVAAGADIVSIDCTDCARGDGLTSTEFLKAVRQKYPNIIIMADCAAFEEAVAAHAAGATPRRRPERQANRILPLWSNWLGRFPARSSRRGASTRRSRRAGCWSRVRGPWWWAARSRVLWRSRPVSWPPSTIFREEGYDPCFGYRWDFR